MNREFKILVLKCPDKKRWYHDKIGKEYTFIKLHMNLDSKKYYFHVVTNDSYPENSRSVIAATDGIFVCSN